jgi:hypothetical protein
MNCWRLDRTVARRKTGGKSELRRAVCRITSGRVPRPSLLGRAIRRKVPQKTYRPGGNAEVRVKRCGKSAPPLQQCSGQGKPHTEQDQIGREPGASASGTCRLGASQPPGRSLEPRSNARPRGMTVPPEQSGGQNSAYRSGCHKLIYFQALIKSGPIIVTPV